MEISAFTHPKRDVLVINAVHTLTDVCIGTTLPLLPIQQQSIQQQSLPVTPPSPPVTQATREGTNPLPTTKPQPSDSSAVLTTAAPLSSKVVSNGPHTSTNTISSSGKTDVHKEKFQNEPSTPCTQQNLTSLPTFSERSSNKTTTNTATLP